VRVVGAGGPNLTEYVFVPYERLRPKSLEITSAAIFHGCSSLAKDLCSWFLL